MREHDCSLECATYGGPPVTFCRMALIGPGPGGCCTPPGRVEGVMERAIREGTALPWPEGWPRPVESPEALGPGPVMGPRRKRGPAGILIF